MKKILTLGLILAMALTMFTACSSEEVPSTVSQTVNIAALNGPTGMAMVDLMDMEDKYAITTYQAPTDITAKIINGEVDVAAVPSNLAAVLYNKTEGDIVAVSPIALGMLQILGNNADVQEVSDLAGKTIIASGQGGTPEYVLQKVLQDNGLTIYEDVNVQWVANHSEVNTQLLSQEGTIAMIPEPFVSTALAQGQEGVTKLFDLNELWEEATGQQLPMGVLVATRSFAEDRSDDLKVLLNDLQASVDYVNDSPAEAAKAIVEHGFIGDEAIAEAAIPNCHIVLYTGDNAAEGIEMLKTFNQTLYDMDPASVGGALPDENLYYQ
ncbi:MAG: ABC transporter substrate-binding protein [Anaerovoracaceae bacterium]